MSCELIPVLLHKPNLPDQVIYYCETCKEAWSQRLLKGTQS